jgi:hypothetical protein
MNSPQYLSVEEASRLAVTATVTDLEVWAHNVAVKGRVELDELLGVLGVLRSASMPEHRSAPTLTALSAS